MAQNWGAKPNPRHKQKKQSGQQTLIPLPPKQKASRAGKGRRRRSPHDQAMRDKYPNVCQWSKGRPVSCWNGGDIPKYCYDPFEPELDCPDMYPDDRDANRADLEAGGDGRICRCLFASLMEDEWKANEGIIDKQVYSTADVDTWQYCLDVKEARDKGIKAMDGWNTKE